MISRLALRTPAAGCDSHRAISKIRASDSSMPSAFSAAWIRLKGSISPTFASDRVGDLPSDGDTFVNRRIAREIDAHHHDNQLVEDREGVGTLEVKDLRRAGESDMRPDAFADRRRDQFVAV